MYRLLVNLQFWAGTRAGEADFCVMFEQQPLLDSRQLVHNLLFCLGTDAVSTFAPTDTTTTRRHLLRTAFKTRKRNDFTTQLKPYCKLLFKVVKTTTYFLHATCNLSWVPIVFVVALATHAGFYLGFLVWGEDVESDSGWGLQP